MYARRQLSSAGSAAAQENVTAPLNDHRAGTTAVWKGAARQATGDIGCSHLQRLTRAITQRFSNRNSGLVRLDRPHSLFAEVITAHGVEHAMHHLKTEPPSRRPQPRPSRPAVGGGVIRLDRRQGHGGAAVRAAAAHRPDKAIS